MTAFADLSVQPYSVRERLAVDFQGILAALREIGLTRVEPFGMLDMAADLEAGLAAHGVTAPTTHQSLVNVEVDRVFQFRRSRSWGSGP